MKHKNGDQCISMTICWAKSLVISNHARWTVSKEHL